MEVRSDSAQRDFHTEKRCSDTLKAKTDYLNAQVAESQICKQLFFVTNSLLGESKVSPLPANIPAAQFPHSFLWVFHWRNQTNKAKPWQHPLSSRYNRWARYGDTACSVFTISEQVHNILKKTAQKTCELDPVPASLLYENIDLLLPVLANINRSLLSGEVPS